MLDMQHANFQLLTSNLKSSWLSRHRWAGPSASLDKSMRIELLTKEYHTLEK